MQRCERSLGRATSQSGGGGGGGGGGEGGGVHFVGTYYDSAFSEVRISPNFTNF